MARLQEKALERKKQLKVANNILLCNQADRDVCGAKLKVCHLRALLTLGCGISTKDLANKKKPDLLDMYWPRHVDVEFEVKIGMHVSRYFGDDLYNGEVTELVEGGGTIVYEDGDSEHMDLEQIYYAHLLYIAEN